MDKEYILGVFNDEHALISAFEKVKATGIKPVEVYMPYPVHEILEGMGKKTKITHAAFVYGALGSFGVLGFLYYAAVISWPLHYGGKPFNSFPSFIVVTIVATILVITLLTLFTFSVRAKIFPGKEPQIMHGRATDDKFVMVLDKNTLGENAAIINAIINEHGKIE